MVSVAKELPVLSNFGYCSRSCNGLEILGRSGSRRKRKRQFFLGIGVSRIIILAAKLALRTCRVLACSSPSWSTTTLSTLGFGLFGRELLSCIQHVMIGCCCRKLRPSTDCCSQASILLSLDICKVFLAYELNKRSISQGLLFVMNYSDK